MSDITYEQALAAVRAGLEKSQEIGVKMNIAVVDAAAKLYPSWVTSLTAPSMKS
jgi:uncharacterized protein GlcG (DUF336 family)